MAFMLLDVKAAACARLFAGCQPSNITLHDFEDGTLLDDIAWARLTTRASLYLRVACCGPLDSSACLYLYDKANGRPLKEPITISYDSTCDQLHARILQLLPGIGSFRMELLQPGRRIIASHQDWQAIMRDKPVNVRIRLILSSLGVAHAGPKARPSGPPAQPPPTMMVAPAQHAMLPVPAVAPAAFGPLQHGAQAAPAMPPMPPPIIPAPPAHPPPRGQNPHVCPPLQSLSLPQPPGQGPVVGGIMSPSRADVDRASAVAPTAPAAVDPLIQPSAPPGTPQGDGITAPAPPSVITAPDPPYRPERIAARPATALLRSPPIRYGEPPGRS